MSDNTSFRAKFAKFSKVKSKAKEKYDKANKPILVISVILVAVAIFAYVVIRTSNFIFNSDEVERQTATTMTRNVSAETIISAVEDGVEEPPTANNASTDPGAAQPSNPTVPGVTPSAAPPAETPANGESVIAYFMAAGYNRNAAIGFVANFQTESHDLSYTAVSSSGNYHGVGQWDNGRWATYQTFLVSKGLTDSLNSQLAFAVAEANGTDGVTPQYTDKLSVSALNACASKYQATKIVARYFERCPSGSAKIPIEDGYPDPAFESACQGGKERLDNANSY